MAVDQECGVTVEPQKAAASMEYQGTTYYFCSKGCHQEFAAHPEKYAVKKSGGEHSGHTHGHG
jgi:Cu+-exporting ATPase